MYTVYFNFNLKSKIKFEKLGIIIRKLKKGEKNYILNNVEKIMNYKQEIIEFYEKTKDLDENSFTYLLKLNKISDEKKRDIIISGAGMLRSGFEFNSIQYINNIIDKMAIITVDNSMFKNYLDENSEKKFISNLLAISNLLEGRVITKNILKKIDYSFILQDNLLDENDPSYLNNLMIYVVFHYKKVDNRTIKEVFTSMSSLKKLEKFFNNLDSDNLLKFLEILELMFNKYSMIQNAIISNITIVEGLVVKETENIEKAYVLKSGIILKNYLNTKANDELTNLLLFTYSIRSDIVHGNYVKIINDLNKLNQKSEAIKELIGQIDQIKDKKQKAYKIAYDMSFIVARLVIRYWIEKPLYIDFLKHN